MNHGPGDTAAGTSLSGVPTMEQSIGEAHFVDGSGSLLQSSLAPAQGYNSCYSNLSFDYLNHQAAATHQINPFARPFLQQAAAAEVTTAGYSYHGNVTITPVASAAAAGQGSSLAAVPTTTPATCQAFDAHLVQQVPVSVFSQGFHHQDLAQLNPQQAGSINTPSNVGGDTKCTGQKLKQPLKGQDGALTGIKKCTAELAIVFSEEELRRKGTAFLRTHASEHGLINSSRQKLQTVVRALSQHYAEVHHFQLSQDLLPPSNSGGGQEEPSGSVRGPRVVTLQPVVTAVKSKPEPLHPDDYKQPSQFVSGPLQTPIQGVPGLYPVNRQPEAGELVVTSSTSATSYLSPSSTTVDQYSAIPQCTNPRVLSSSASNCPKSTATKAPKRKPSGKKEDVTKGGLANELGLLGGVTLPQTHNPHGCRVPVMARNKEELKKVSTSLLRPHASLHKVLNSSRRNKLDVVEELWDHYEKFHPEAVQEANSQVPIANGQIAHGQVADDQTANGQVANVSPDSTTSSTNYQPLVLTPTDHSVTAKYLPPQQDVSATDAPPQQHATEGRTDLLSAAVSASKLFPAPDPNSALCEPSSLPSKGGKWGWVGHVNDPGQEQENVNSQ